MIPVALYYIRWHYGVALHDFIRIIGNFIWFFNEFFSIPLLLKTFFVPFHRLQEAPTKGFKPSVWFEAFIVNTLMRAVGAFLRLFLIMLGMLLIAATFLGGGLLFVAWLLSPFLVVFLLLSGFVLMTLG